MTAPIYSKKLFKRGRLTGNDEAQRARARGIHKLAESYQQGSAYSDIDRDSTTAEKLDAAKDYDMFSRVRSRSLKHTRLPKKRS